MCVCVCVCVCAAGDTARRVLPSRAMKGQRKIHDSSLSPDGRAETTPKQRAGVDYV